MEKPKERLLKLMIKTNMRTKLALISFFLFAMVLFVNSFKEYLFSLDSGYISHAMKANVYIFPFILISWILAVIVLIKEMKNKINWINILLILPALTLGSIFVFTFIWLCFL